MVVLIDLCIFALGLMSGAVLTVLMQVAKPPLPPKPEGTMNWFRKIGAVKEERQIATQTVPSRRASWRSTMKDLQAKHNSVQRERDSRMPHA